MRTSGSHTRRYVEDIKFPAQFGQQHDYALCSDVRRMLTDLFLPQSKVITASWDGLIKLWVRCSLGTFLVNSHLMFAYLSFHFQLCFFTPTGLSLLHLERCTLQLGLRCQLYDDIKRAHLLRPPLSSIVSALEFSDKQPTCSALSQRLRFFLFDFTPCPALKPEATFVSLC